MSVRIDSGNCPTHLNLLRLFGLLLLLCLSDSCKACLGTRLRCLIPPCSNRSKVGANNTALMLHGASRAFLCDLLRDTLPVHPSVNLCPCNLTGIFALQEKGFIFGNGEAENLENARELSWRGGVGTAIGNSPCYRRGRTTGLC